MTISAIITGATGMVGEGVLLACLDDPRVSRVLVVNRRPAGLSHPKLREIVHPALDDIGPIADQLAGFDACFFCLGVSSIGMREADYRRVTHDLTLGFARTLAALNPDTVFTYVTGAGTDTSEQGRTMWARVKGATENELLRLLPRAVMFRPGAMLALPGQRRLKGWYKALAWLLHVAHALAPRSVLPLRDVARAMVNAAVVGTDKRVLEVADIAALARRA
jgi:uncharacterized protein YbjT (DUF2867 family)